MLTAGPSKFRFRKFMHLWELETAYGSILAHSCLTLLSSYLLSVSREVGGILDFFLSSFVLGITVIGLMKVEEVPTNMLFHLCCLDFFSLNVMMLMFDKLLVMVFTKEIWKSGLNVSRDTGNSISFACQDLRELFLKIPEWLIVSWSLLVKSKIGQMVLFTQSKLNSRHRL